MRPATHYLATFHGCCVTQVAIAQINQMSDMTSSTFLSDSRAAMKPFIRRCLLLSAISLVVMTPPTMAADDTIVVREYVEIEEQTRFDSLLEDFGQNKDLPTGYELQALLALSHYPQLKNVRIKFVLDDVAIPLSSRPHWSSMLRSSRKRTYQVIMDTNMEGPRSALLLKNQPFNAQIGIIGHELAHTVYYLNRSFFGIIGDALCQLSSCRIDFERNTDKRLIDYGLGWQRYDHASFVRGRFAESSGEALSTEEGGGGAYMSPAALLRIIDDNPIYAD